MLKPSDRLSYQEILKPASGYEIDYVVATTFSLDINTLLLASLSLANYKFADKDEALSDPLALLKSLRDIKDKFVIFCQNDRIAPIQKGNELIGFLDSLVIPVKPAKGSSFHPKVWIVRMKNGDDIIYRVAVLSRNLTFDRSWDIAVSLDGVVTDKEQHGDLGVFIKDLVKLGGGSLKESAVEKIKVIQKELPRVKFDLPEDSFDLDFKYQNSSSKFSSSFRGKYNRMLVISPFVTEDALEKLMTKVYNSEKELFLISRPEELDRIKNRQLLKKFKGVFCLNDGFQSDEHDEGDDNKLHGLHAKIIIAQKSHDNYFYAGSSNATNRGMEGINYEFMVKLVNNRRELNPQNMLEDDSGLGKMIIPYISKPVGDSSEQEIRKIKDTIRDSVVLLCKELEVKIEGNVSKLYLHINNVVEFDGSAEIYCWSCGMLENEAKLISSAGKESTVFLGNVNEALINSFVSFCVKFNHNDIPQKFYFTLKLPIIGVPDDREAKLLNYIIKNSSMFFKYLMMLMGSITGITPGSIKPGGSIEGYKNINYMQYGISDITAESLLRCYASYPERFKKIQDFMKEYQENKTNEAKLPDEFLAIWKVFQQAAEKTDAI